MALLQRNATDIITFTRAGGGGRFNWQGHFEWLASNELRIDHDPATVATSLTSNSLAKGSKTFEVARQYAVGQIVRASVDASNYMIGRVTAATATSVTIEASKVVGSGTYSSWTLIVRLGMLVEEQRTNLLTYSSDFSNEAWSMVGVTAEYDVAEGGVAIVSDNSNGIHALRRVVVAGSIGQPVTFSARARPGSAAFVGLTLLNGGRTVQAAWDMSSKVPIRSQVAGTGVLTGSGIADLGNGEVEVWISGYFTDINTYDIRIGVTTAEGSYTWTGDGASSIIPVSAQLEAGSFPTSYIPTTSAQVTRAADIANVNTLSPWFRADEGTLFVEAFSAAGRPNAVGASLDDNTSQNRIEARFSGSAVSTARGEIISGVPQATLLVPISASITLRRFAVAYKTDDFALAVLGGSPVVDPSGSVPSVTWMQVGRAVYGGSEINGHIRSIRYYPRRLSDSELQALTQ